MSHFQEDKLYHIRYQMLFSSMKSLTHIHVECRLSCACFQKKFPIPISLGFTSNYTNQYSGVLKLLSNTHYEIILTKNFNIVM